ncbi:hypothetical protein [Streptomyces chartreusis]|uniref:hypothetical protein n=1 Tax=Streptomyces chartreusis TaxID=1969 RepID=UPI003684EB4E
MLVSPSTYGPQTRLRCCPPTCGTAAAVVCTKSSCASAQSPSTANPCTATVTNVAEDGRITLAFKVTLADGTVALLDEAVGDAA